MMKAACALAVLAALGSAPASAANIDLNTFTCEQYVALPTDLHTMMWYWMDGQLHGAANDTSFDPGQIKDLVMGLDAACEERGKEPALSVYEDISK